jgi:hypothetical protein
MFRTVPLSIIGSYSLYTQRWYMSYRQLPSSSRIRCSILILLLLDNYLHTCMTYTIVKCTVNNSWWWTEELSETCRVSFQNKFEKLVHLVGFVIRMFVTMHGHMNVKKTVCVLWWVCQCIFTFIKQNIPALPIIHSTGLFADPTHSKFCETCYS